ncbi:GNAT family N-acetyltransferase [Yoonia sp. SS1-5]|uniref:GNAT family N-acetyltransferase n=1 Tax=Yoonia rhodophyticola TaxID=3137370 RepID=A0AAN0NKQ4_9RHOB
MCILHPPFRLANANDASRLAALVNFAGDGLPLYLWQKRAKPGEDPWQIGRDRQAEKATDGTVVVMDDGDGAVASLTGYVIGAGPEPIDPGLSALLRPLLELENMALNSWYVNVLACYPARRGAGIGTGLLDIAEQLARAAGLGRMSVIVADDNTGARRLYERHGFKFAASAPCAKQDWDAATKEWQLMIRTLSPRGS